MLLRLLALARAPVELAEAEVTVGDERAHPQRFCERERVTVMTVSALRGLAALAQIAGGRMPATEGKQSNEER